MHGELDQQKFPVTVTALRIINYLLIMKPGYGTISLQQAFINLTMRLCFWSFSALALLSSIGNAYCAPSDSSRTPDVLSHDSDANLYPTSSYPDTHMSSYRSI
jgi:hypothetical protein